MDIDDSLIQGPEANFTESQTPDSDTQKDGSLMDIDAGYLTSNGEKFSVPCFLRKVLLRDDFGGNGNEYRLVVVAVHAVMLESGFVALDTVSGNESQLSYSLPERISSPSGGAIDIVVLKFENFRGYVKVCGSLARDGTGMYKVLLNVDRFVQDIDLEWADESYSENEFWKRLKDELVLPLMIDVCQCWFGVSTMLNVPPRSG